MAQEENSAGEGAQRGGESREQCLPEVDQGGGREGGAEAGQLGRVCSTEECGPSRPFQLTSVKCEKV